MCSMCITAIVWWRLHSSVSKTHSNQGILAQQTVDFNGILSADSKVCKLCLDFHGERIIKFEASNNEVITDKECLWWIVCKVALQPDKTFQQDKTILLREVHADLAVWLVNLKNNFQMWKSRCEQIHLVSNGSWAHSVTILKKTLP